MRHQFLAQSWSSRSSVLVMPSSHALPLSTARRTCPGESEHLYVSVTTVAPRPSGGEVERQRDAFLLGVCRVDAGQAGLPPDAPVRLVHQDAVMHLVASRAGASIRRDTDTGLHSSSPAVVLPRQFLPRASTKEVARP
jgi:hypothetical protein